MSRIISLTFTLILLFSCADKDSAEPDFNIPGIKTSISRILVSPLAHDGARVVIAGFIKNIETKSESSESNLITLTDINDNSIKIEFNSSTGAVAGDQVLAAGIYRKDINRLVDAEIYEFVVEDDVIKPLNN